MASIRARLMVLLLRRQVKRKISNSTDITQVRRAFEGAMFGAPSGVRMTPATLGGVAGEWLQTDAPGPLTILYVHGGAFIACSPRTHRAATGALAKRGFRVFAPDYRLAPEHPFPAALDDVHAAYEALLACGIAPAQLLLAGESAGGNLVLSLALRLRDEGKPLPAAIAAWSPITDLAGTGASLTENGRIDAMLDGKGTAALVQAYLPPGTDPKHPLVSPLYADFAGLPPLLMHVGQNEVLRDDTTRLVERARRAGVSVDLEVWPVVPHAWQLFPIIPEARRSIDQTSAFLRRHARA